MTDSGRDRLESMFARARRENRAVLLPYLTAGIPSVEDSVAIFKAMSDAGADGFEVGIPYADPLMDGPVIMEAGEIALERGVTVAVALEIVRRVAQETGKPVLVMTYVNPVLRRGIDTFFGEVADAGAAGVIIADLPADESAPFRAAATETKLGLSLFVAPTTDDVRLESVLAGEPAFVYGIAQVGVTGARETASANTRGLAQRIRAHSNVPIVFGVGITTLQHAGAAARDGDGVIVGTAVVRKVLEADSLDQAIAALEEFIEGLALAMKRE